MSPANPTALLDADAAAYPVKYSLPKPELREHYRNGTIVRWASAQPDVYDLLGDYGSAGIKEAECLGFVLRTTGWAAPMTEDGQPDGQPSRHPQRRRVALHVAATLEGVVSRIHFEDTGETIDDEGTATGSLAEIVHTTALSVLGPAFVEWLTDRVTRQAEGGEDE